MTEADWWVSYGLQTYQSSWVVLPQKDKMMKSLNVAVVITVYIVSAHHK